MPTYEYECSACGHGFDIIQSMTDKKLRTCPKCKKTKLHRLIGAGTGIIFKGSGFYQTDYKNKPAPAADSGSSAGSCGQGGCGCKPSGPPANKPK